jgi:hypothetical protein
MRFNILQLYSVFISTWLAYHLFRYFILGAPVGKWFSYSNNHPTIGETKLNSCRVTSNSFKTKQTSSSIEALEMLLVEKKDVLQDIMVENTHGVPDVCPLILAIGERDQPYWIWMTSLLLKALVEPIRERNIAMIQKPILLFVSDSSTQLDAEMAVRKGFIDRLTDQGAITYWKWEGLDATENAKRKYFPEHVLAWKECVKRKDQCRSCMVSEDIAVLDKSPEEIKQLFFQTLLLADRNALRWGALFFSNKNDKPEAVWNSGALVYLIAMFAVVAVMVSIWPSKRKYFLIKPIGYMLFFCFGTTACYLTFFNRGSKPFINVYLQSLDAPSMYFIKPSCAQLLLDSIESDILLDYFTLGGFISSTCGAKGQDVLTVESRFVFSAENIACEGL